MPGFDISNKTIWPLEVSLGLLSPLYWGVVEPGQTFSRGTGAVWFTLNAAVALDHKEHITTGQAVFEAVKGVLWHVKLGEWLINGQFLDSLRDLPDNVAQELHGGAPVLIKGNRLDKMPAEEAQKAVQEVFTERSRVRATGCYAGFWRGHKQYTVTGGPTLRRVNGGVELTPGNPLSFNKV